VWVVVVGGEGGGGGTCEREREREKRKGVRYLVLPHANSHTNWDSSLEMLSLESRNAGARAARA
jgi:hypothetical protein